MAITQLTTANTFQQWLIATQALITTANTLTDGNGASFIANTKLDISGSQSQLNVRNNAGINQLYANNISISGNVATINTTSNLYVGGNTEIYGDLTVSGNIYLDSIGFDDIVANGSGHFANNLTVGGYATITGNTTLSNSTTVYGNFSTANVTFLTGTANTALYANIATIQAYATSAGAYANTAFITANAAFLQANTPSYTANSAAIYANGAFAAANSASDQSVAFAIALG